MGGIHQTPIPYESTGKTHMPNKMFVFLEFPTFNALVFITDRKLDTHILMHCDSYGNKNAIILTYLHNFEKLLHKNVTVILLNIAHMKSV